MLVILVAIYGFALRRGQGEAEARALAFTTLIIANLCLILTNRSWSRTVLATARSRNPALWWVVVGALVFPRAGALRAVPARTLSFRKAALG